MPINPAEATMLFTAFLKRSPVIAVALAFVLGAASAQSAAVAAGQSQHQSQQQTLEKQLAELLQTRQHIVDDSARTRERLSAAEADLQLKEKELHSAITAAKTDEREKVQREATLVSIIYNRELARTERLQKDLAEQDLQLRSINRQQQDLQAELTRLRTALRQVAAQPPAPQPASGTESPAPATAPQKTAATTPVPAPVPAADWPTAERARPQDIAFARARLFPATPVNPEQSIFASVKISSALFGSRTMQFAGDKLYTINLTGKPGTQTFTVFKHQFWHTFPADSANRDYIAIYDAESLSKPRLIIFPAALLQ
jgi:hypothetical protein